MAFPTKVVYTNRLWHQNDSILDSIRKSPFSYRKDTSIDRQYLQREQDLPFLFYLGRLIYEEI